MTNTTTTTQTDKAPTAPTCPKCGTSDQLGSVEQLHGWCAIVVDPDTGAWSFGGRTDMNWDSSVTVAWYCRNCDTRIEDPDWINQFGPGQ